MLPTKNKKQYCSQEQISCLLFLTHSLEKIFAILSDPNITSDLTQKSFLEADKLDLTPEV